MFGVGELEKLLKEADVIKAAPRSFTLVCLAAIAIIWGGFHFEYKSDLDAANGHTTNAQEDAEHWHQAADYYKDLASRPVQHEVSPSTPVASPTKPEIPREKHPPGVTKEPDGGGSLKPPQSTEPPPTVNYSGPRISDHGIS
jgi:hypothetical protein